MITSSGKYTGEDRVEKYEFVILATGFKNLGGGVNDESFPQVLSGVSSLYLQNEHGFCQVNYDYSLQPKVSDAPSVYLNGLCEVTHGMGDAGTFSLLSLRAKSIGESVISKHNR